MNWAWAPEAIYEVSRPPVGVVKINHVIRPYEQIDLYMIFVGLGIRRYGKVGYTYIESVGGSSCMEKIEIKNFSKRYDVRKLILDDMKMIYEFCKSNTQKKF